MKVIETEFVVKAGRGAFRKARKKAFALLKTHGYRNYISVEVCCKRVIKELCGSKSIRILFDCMKLITTISFTVFHLQK